MNKPAVPKGLGPAGKRLWSSVVDEYDLAEQELILLVQAVHTADLCDRLQAQVNADGLLVSTEQGGVKPHPALVEARQQRITLARLLVALQVPFGEDGEVTGGPRTQRRGIRGVYGSGS